jgi:hypothetical protein
MLAMAIVAILIGSASAAVPAPASVQAPSWSQCFLDVQANLATLERSLEPAQGATLALGGSARLAGPSQAPLQFAIASSPAGLASPDIDAGSGIEGAPSGPGEPPIFSFVSHAAGAKPGTVYWSASFSDASFADCSGEAEHTYATAPRALTVEEAKGVTETGATRECVVPDLRRERLDRARRELRAAGCRLGGVRRRGRGGAVVRRQHPRPGRRLGAGALVTVLLAR